jgi:Xaa-Pro aminopeptidase
LGLDVHDLEDLGDMAGYPGGRKRSVEPGARFLRLDRDLESGMVVTIEPGFYRIESLLHEAKNDPRLSSCIDFERLDRFHDVRGIRIEDDVLITDAGAEVLTQGAPKAPASVELACGC